MFDEVIVVYKFIGDLMFFVTGSQDENELILAQVLQGFYESISLLLRRARWLWGCYIGVYSCHCTHASLCASLWYLVHGY